MQQISRSILLPYSKQNLFDLVNDISRYPEFLPGCSGSSILQETDGGVLARLSLKKAGINYELTTNNFLYPPDRIEMELVEGPLDKLEGSWFFSSLGDSGCKVEMTLNYELKGKLFNKTLGKILTGSVEMVVDAFSRRADALYGKKERK